MPKPRKASSDRGIVIDLGQGLDFVAETVEEGVARGLGRVFQSFKRPAVELDGDGYLCQGADGCTMLTRRICLSCRKPFCRTHSEFIHQSGAYGLCLRCTRFLFRAGHSFIRAARERERVSPAERAAREAREARERAQSSRPVDDGPLPWLVLGVPESADLAEVTSAFRALAKETHPDLARTPEERTRREERFKLVSVAYEAMRKRLEEERK